MTSKPRYTMLLHDTGAPRAPRPGAAAAGVAAPNHSAAPGSAAAQCTAHPLFSHSGCLHVIFCHLLDDERALAAASCVSRAWRAVAAAEGLWTIAYTRKHGLPAPHEKLSWCVGLRGGWRRRAADSRQPSIPAAPFCAKTH